MRRSAIARWGSVMSAVVMLAACGGGGESNGVEGGDKPAPEVLFDGKTVITKKNASYVLRAVYDAVQAINETRGVASIGAAEPLSKASAFQLKEATVARCPDGGTYVADVGDGFIKIEYNDCWSRIGGERIMIDGSGWARNESGDAAEGPHTQHWDKLTWLSPAISYTYSGEQTSQVTTTSVDPFAQHFEYEGNDLSFEFHDMDFNVDRRVTIKHTHGSSDTLNRVLVNSRGRLDGFDVDFKGNSVPTPLAVEFSSGGGLIGSTPWSGDILYTVTAGDGSSAQLSADSSLAADDKVKVELRVDEDGAGELTLTATMTLAEFMSMTD